MGVVGADMFVTNGWSQWGAKVVGAACCARVARAVRQRVASVRTGLSIVYDIYWGHVPRLISRQRPTKVNRALNINNS